jgi:hypothetical protein
MKDYSLEDAGCTPRTQTLYALGIHCFGNAPCMTVQTLLQTPIGAATQHAVENHELSCSPGN